MFTNEWLLWLKRSFRLLQKDKQGKMRHPRYRPVVESLEDRSLMSVTVLSTAAVTPGSPLATANGLSEAQPVHSISDDGRFVVFTSNAGNLVSGQSTAPGQLNVFLHDNLYDTTTLISHEYGNTTTGGSSYYGYDSGSSFNPVISGDGSTVAFYSEADDLASGENTFNTNNVGLYLYNTTTGTMTLASHAYGDPNTVGYAFSPAIPSSGDTHWVNTLGYSSSLSIGADINGLAVPSLSHDGKYVAYISDANNLVGTDSGGTSGYWDGFCVTNVYLYDNNPSDMGYGTNHMISHAYNTDGSDNWSASVDPLTGAWATTVAISADGSTVAFTDPATNLIASPNGVSGASDQLYVWSRINNTSVTGLFADQTVLASHSSSSATTGASNPSGWTAENPPSLSANGAEVAYYDPASNLVSGQSGTAGMLNVFRYNVLTNTNDLVTHTYASTTTAGNGPANQVAGIGQGPAEATGPQISADGQYIAYANNSSNLISGMSNSSYRDNVYLYDGLTNSNTLVSNNGTTNTPDAGGGTAPSMGFDGTHYYVTFADLAVPATGDLTTMTHGIVNVRLFTSGSSLPPTSLGYSFDTAPLPALTLSDGSSISASSLAFYSAAFQPTVISADGTTIVWSGPASTNPTAPSVTDGNQNIDVFEVINQNATTTNTITSISNPTFTTGVPVLFPITANSPPTSITITNGTLPAGLTFNTTTATITGTPTTPTATGVTDNVTFTATFPSGAPATQNLTITVNPGQISNITLSNSTVTAYQPVGTVVGTVTATDPNVGQTVTYSLAGPNAGLFTIDSAGNIVTNGVFATTTTQSYNVTVQATDSLGLTSSQTFTVTVNPSTAPPTAITLTNSTVTAYRSSGTVVGTVNSTDPNVGQAVSYTLAGPDANLFTIDSSGELKTNSVLGTTTAQTYSVIVQATDSLGLSSSQTFTITADPSTAAPTNITLSNTATTAYRPIGTVIGSLSSSDPNIGQTTVYTLTGADANLFTVDSAGNLKTNSVLTPQSYSITVVATDTLNLSSSQGFTIVANAAPAASLSLSADESGTVGQTYGAPLVATVYDAEGYPVPNVSVTFTLPVSGPGGTLTTLSATTDANGQVSDTLTADDMAGSFTVGVTVNDGSNPAGAFHMTNLADAPASISLSGDNQTAALGAPFASPLTATVVDVHGNPVPNVTVTFTPPVSGASGTLSGLTAVTDANGQVTETLTANTVAGAFAVTVSVSGGSNPTSHFLNLANIASVPASVTITGSGQTATVAHAYASSLVVTVLDASGLPVPNKTVTFTRPTTGASGTLSATTAITNSSGQVTVHFTANTVAGNLSIGVAVTGGSNPTGVFALTNTADLPASVAVSGGGIRATVATAFTTPLIATVFDRYGNPVPNVTVTFTLPISGASGTLSGGATGVSDANGKVTKILTANTKSGSYTVHVAVTGGSNPANTIAALTNTAGAAVSMSLSFVNPPAIFLAGNQLPYIVIQLLDQYGNNAAPTRLGTPVTITLAGGKKFRGGSSSFTTTFNATGAATFSGLFIDLAGSYTLGVKSAGLTANNNLSFTVKPRKGNSAKGVN